MEQYINQLEKQTNRPWTVLGEINTMKTLRISDHAHRELTRWLGEMMAQSGKAQTFSDVIDALVSRAILLPPELLKHVAEFVEANKQLGYTTREEFIREAITEAPPRLSACMHVNNVVSENIDLKSRINRTEQKLAELEKAIHEILEQTS